MLVRNDARTIKLALDSVKQHEIVVGDLGSTDGSPDICRSYGAKVFPMEDARRDVARSKLPKGEWNLWLEPWEVVASGHEQLGRKDGKHFVSVMTQKILTKEIRAWTGDVSFENPIYETISGDTDSELPVVLYSLGGIDQTYAVTNVTRWMNDQPINPRPHYYSACLALSGGRHEDFLRLAEHYLSMDRTSSMSAVMTRYYYAYVSLAHKRNAKAALQNLNLCLCAKPLMAEFWCLQADVFYHLFRRYDVAKEFYENAVVLGARRLRSDKWPMDIAKYSSYPNKMIGSCDKIMASVSLYGKT